MRASTSSSGRRPFGRWSTSTSRAARTGACSSGRCSTSSTGAARSSAGRSRPSRRRWSPRSVHSSLLEQLVDPATKEPLELAGVSPEEGDIVEGRLRSGNGAEYPIVRGIPRFVADADDDQGQTSESFGFKWEQRHTYESPKVLDWSRAVGPRPVRLREPGRDAGVLRRTGAHPRRGLRRRVHDVALDRSRVAERRRGRVGRRRHLDGDRRRAGPARRHRRAPLRPGRRSQPAVPRGDVRRGFLRGGPPPHPFDRRSAPLGGLGACRRRRAALLRLPQEGPDQGVLRRLRAGCVVGARSGGGVAGSRAPDAARARARRARRDGRRAGGDPSARHSRRPAEPPAARLLALPEALLERGLRRGREQPRQLRLVPPALRAPADRGGAARLVRGARARRSCTWTRRRAASRSARERASGRARSPGPPGGRGRGGPARLPGGPRRQARHGPPPATG